MPRNNALHLHSQRSTRFLQSQGPRRKLTIKLAKMVGGQTMMFYIAAFFCFAVGCAHSYLGERKIIAPLLRRGELPKIRNSEETTARVIRVAWHMTTLLFWVSGVLFILMAQNKLNVQNVSISFASLFLPMGLISLVVSRGRHVSWPPFLIVGGICLYAATT
ncbi:MAG: hypothetical protein KJO19_11480 [Woeseia sp.]|nr:hypothetical protein [Woeseia sp.]MBT8097648.1 hypothetical protein [Woeseia sp.]